MAKRLFFIDPIVFFKDTYKMLSFYSAAAFVDAEERNNLLAIMDYAKEHVMTADKDWVVLAGKLHILHENCVAAAYNAEEPWEAMTCSYANAAMCAQALYEKAIKSFTGGRVLPIPDDMKDFFLDEGDSSEEEPAAEVDSDAETQPLPTEEKNAAAAGVEAGEDKEKNKTVVGVEAGEDDEEDDDEVLTQPLPEEENGGEKSENSPASSQSLNLLDDDDSDFIALPPTKRVKKSFSH